MSGSPNARETSLTSIPNANGVLFDKVAVNGARPGPNGTDGPDGTNSWAHAGPSCATEAANNNDAVNAKRLMTGPPFL